MWSLVPQALRTAAAEGPSSQLCSPGVAPGREQPCLCAPSSTWATAAPCRCRPGVQSPATCTLGTSRRPGGGAEGARASPARTAGGAGGRGPATLGVQLQPGTPHHGGRGAGPGPQRCPHPGCVRRGERTPRWEDPGRGGSVRPAGGKQRHVVVGGETGTKGAGRARATGGNSGPGLGSPRRPGGPWARPGGGRSGVRSSGTSSMCGVPTRRKS